MKALTVWQPWASLIACGAKRYETRSWATSYRGPIAIHAAATNPMPLAIQLPYNARDTMMKVLFRDIGTYMFEDLPRGCIIATAELVNVWRTCYHPGADVDRAIGIPIGAESLMLDRHDPEFGKIVVPSEQELIFGDWTPVRFAWELTDVKMLDKPIPAKGHQRLWNWDSTGYEIQEGGI